MDYNTRMNLDLMSVIETQWRKQLHAEEELEQSVEAMKTTEKMEESKKEEEKKNLEQKRGKAMRENERNKQRNQSLELGFSNWTYIEAYIEEKRGERERVKRRTRI